MAPSGVIFLLEGIAKEHLSRFDGGIVRFPLSLGLLVVKLG
jgi:hypothetical protein